MVARVGRVAASSAGSCPSVELVGLMDPRAGRGREVVFRILREQPGSDVPGRIFAARLGVGLAVARPQRDPDAGLRRVDLARPDITPSSAWYSAIRV